MEHRSQPAAHEGTNRLADEKSPYLLQHVHNPVDWYPWCDEAFERARQEDRPIFLSIGYATCHWCHVMAHESFEDPEVARELNRTFVCIKVDREERPDIDAIYMEACQMMTGGGGWPLTVLMTAERKPFFTGTYIPRTTRFGHVGLLDIVPRVREMWREQRQELLRAAERITDALRTPPRRSGRGMPDHETLDRCARQLSRRFDTRHGGFGQAPKFPSPHNLLFLLRHFHRTGTDKSLLMVEQTLRAMRRGGVFDQLGYGFHRYSTDERWLVPHFEKMLYDQAMLALAYLEAYQVTGAEDFASTAREVFEYVLRDLCHAEGAFFSAEDADSEGEEGRFYLWSDPELEELLSGEELALAREAWGLRDDGNFRDEASGHRTGRNILHRSRPLAPLAQRLGLEWPELARRLDAIRRRLLEHRGKRPRPLLDDKILTDWNGLMIAALARGGRVLREPSLTTAAGRALDFIQRRMVTAEGELLHRYRDGEAAIHGMLDDYAFLVWGMLELYEATFDPAQLGAAQRLNQQMLDRLWDAEHGGLFQAPADPDNLLVRQRSFIDGAIPSGNSVALGNLLRLTRLTDAPGLAQLADSLVRAVADQVRSAPAAFTHMMCGIDFALGPSHELVLAAGRDSDETARVRQALQRPFLPRTLLLLRPPDGDEALDQLVALAPLTREQRSLDDKPTLYVCRDFSCREPTTDVERALSLME